MNTVKLIFVALLVATLGGCASTPHVFVSQYSPEVLPAVPDISGDYKIEGSAFLRQGGGGIVNCAGNPVYLSKEFSFSRSNYAREANGLGYGVRNASQIDPRHYQFERDLSQVIQKTKRQTTCDVDGKFNFRNLAPGTYDVKTKVFWMVGDEGQGGILGSKVTVYDDPLEKSVSTVVSSIIKSCRYAMFGCNF
jgi:hypothetical protein